jgi:plasmid replication initiation protein
VSQSKNHLVVKSNKLIEASYRLDLSEQRIILMAITEARDTGKGITSDDFIEIRAVDFSILYGLSERTAYDQLRDAGKSLFRRYVVLKSINDRTGKVEETEARWVSAVTYAAGSGLIRLQFSGVIVPYITRLETEFTSYKLKSVSQMTSNYAVRLYELMVQWQGLKEREIEISELKKMLFVHAEKAYDRIDNFKKKIIDIAVTQINEHSDITVSYTQRKSGRTVTHLTFSFEPKPLINLDPINPYPAHSKTETAQPKIKKPLLQKNEKPQQTANRKITPEAIQPDNRFNNFLALPQEEQEQLRVLFNEGLSSPLRDMWKKYRADNTENPEFKPMFKAAFLDMLKQFEI